MAKKYVDYYKILGVNENASPEQIKKAWIGILKIYYVDLNRNLSAEDKKALEEYNTLVNNAKDELLDPEKRRIYDIKRNNYLRKQELKKQREAAQNTSTEKNIYEQPKTEETSSTVEETKIDEGTEQEDIIDYIIRTYQEVRNEEKKGPNIFERYNARSKILSKYNLSIFSPFFNIMGEIGNHLYKLKRETKEDSIRWTFRNRTGLAAAAAVILTFSLGTNSKPKVEEPIGAQIIDVSGEEDSIEEEKTVLYNYHIVEEGDTLSGLAQRAHISLEELKEFNGIDRDTIYLGEELIIPFSLTDDILEYYTETIEVDNASLEVIAETYKTDSASLKRLNGEAITEDNKILSNELEVPVFLTENEWIHIKYSTGAYTKVNNN